MEKKQNGFFQSLANEAKLGAYYTDLKHSKRIGRLFSIPEKVFLLEPSIGNGSAVKAFLSGCADGEKAEIYGVEIDCEVAVGTKAEIPYTICADFLEGVVIAHRVFSLIFANPPYGTNGFGARLESLFIEKIYKYMQKEGYAVFILPYACLMNQKFQEIFARRYIKEAIYRFDDDEYEKYHQFAVIAKKRPVLLPHADLQEMCALSTLDDCAYIPSLDEEIQPVYIVPAAEKKEVRPFYSDTFVPELVVDTLSESPLYARAKAIMDPVIYRPTEFNNPPTELSASMLCMAAVSGVGSGLAGNEDEGTLHLQKGVVKLEETDEPVYNDKGKVVKAVNTTFQKTSFNILDNYGNFRSLE